MISLSGICRVTIIAAVCYAQLGSGAAQAQTASKPVNKIRPSHGAHTFASTCAGCHGLDGSGSDRAPAIVSNPHAQHLSDAQIAEIISNGVPGTGMPPFGALGGERIRELVSYLRVLQGGTQLRTLSGNAAHGREIFFGEGGCAACHMFLGEGGFYGPDLSGYGSSMSAQAVVAAIVNPTRIPHYGYAAAAITTQEGERLEGLVRSEDNFSVQLLTSDGSFHFLQKSELQTLDYLDRSVMPADYGQKLTATELTDLAAYLMSVADSSRQRRVPGK